MKKIEKIITHAGIFHADEVLAIALLNCYGMSAPVERKFQISEGEFSNPNILILDVGQKFDPVMGNLDHHQDSNSPATNILVVEWLVDKGIMDPEVRANLQEFLGYVSDVDRGIIPNGGIQASFNGIIRSMNSADLSQAGPAFEKAVDLAHKIITSQIAVAERTVADAKIWAGLERTCNGQVVIQEDTYQMAGWKELAETEGVKFLVTPNPRGGWQIISRDAVLFNIPTDSRQTFRHASGFLAVYALKEDALSHVATLI